jgi:hypothetical protein
MRLEESVMWDQAWILHVTTLSDQKRLLHEIKCKNCRRYGENSVWDETWMLYEIRRKYFEISGESIVWEQEWILHIRGKYTIRSGKDTARNQASMLFEFSRENCMRYMRSVYSTMISGKSIMWDQARVLYDIRCSYFMRSVVNILWDQTRILCEVRANFPRVMASILHKIGRG